jgi:exopolysaccharide biosynthesis polyprenyl glycosylphosphotransferase
MVCRRRARGGAPVERSVAGVAGLQGRYEDIAAREAPARAFVHEVAPGTSVRAQYRQIYRKIALTDALSIMVALQLAFWSWRGFHWPHPSLQIALIGVPILMVVIYAFLHLYDMLRTTPAEEFRRILLAVSLGIGGVLALAFSAKTYYSRGWLALSWLFSIVAALISRRLWHAYIGRQRASGRLSFPTLVVGTNQEALHLVEVMTAPSFGFRPLGLVETDEASSGAGRPPTGGVPVLGNIAGLRELIRAVGAECVFVASSALSSGAIGHVAKAVRLEGVEVRVTATLPEVLSSRVAVQTMHGVTALALRPVRLTGAQTAAKRVFDVALGTLAVVILSPVMLVIAVAVRMTSAGPALYRQQRVGQRGRPFTMVKFRTMVRHADQAVDHLRDVHGVQGVMFKLEDDPRVTGLGRWLRRWSLDELPQLFNVIKGEMSLVGPRPPLPAEVSQYDEWQFDRLEVPPGMTGLWQVSGRSELTFDDCVRLDLFYIENWSLAYDLYIVGKTIPVILSKRGAY